MTGDFKIEYPTWGDLAREQVRRHGLSYFGDVQAQIYGSGAVTCPTNNSSSKPVRSVRWRTAAAVASPRTTSLSRATWIVPSVQAYL